MATGGFKGACSVKSARSVGNNAKESEVRLRCADKSEQLNGIKTRHGQGRR